MGGVCSILAGGAKEAKKQVGGEILTGKEMVVVGAWAVVSGALVAVGADVVAPTLVLELGKQRRCRSHGWWWRLAVVAPMVVAPWRLVIAVVWA